MLDSQEQENLYINLMAGGVFVITSYSIHYTKLYENNYLKSFRVQSCKNSGEKGKKPGHHGRPGFFYFNRGQTENLSLGRLV